MAYRNDSFSAVLELERQRLGEDDFGTVQPIDWGELEDMRHDDVEMCDFD